MNSIKAISLIIEFKNWIRAEVNAPSSPEFIYTMRSILAAHGTDGLNFLQTVHIAQHYPYTTCIFASDSLIEAKLITNESEAFDYMIRIGITPREMKIERRPNNKIGFVLSYNGIKKIAAVDQKVKFLIDAYFTFVPLL